MYLKTMSVLLLISIVGCGGGDGFERVTVSGSVSYAGQPLEKGVIRFVPRAGTETTVCGAAIVDGAYILDSKGGVPVGNYKVEIRRAATLDKDTALADEDNDLSRSPIAQQELPAKYNTDSQLEITIASGNGKIVKDFHLTR
ncbi:MAG: hypothetical protein JXM70_23440 [Pirellulales bacterium]|nr:hypothetical protein [Pirellulales bacterium]